jgi:hypothetical protein
VLIPESVNFLVETGVLDPRTKILGFYLSDPAIHPVYQIETW